MRTTTIEDGASARMLVPHVRIARTPWSRARGYLGTVQVEDGDAILFPRCSSIHMFGMKTALDVVYLDRSMTVTGIEERLQPGRLGHAPRGTRHVLECAPGSACGLFFCGQTLRLGTGGEGDA